MLEQRRQEFTRQRQSQIARLLNDLEKSTSEKTFREHGYVWFDGRWQDARALIEQIVSRDLEKQLATQ